MVSGQCRGGDASLPASDGRSAVEISISKSARAVGRVKRRRTTKSVLPNVLKDGPTGRAMTDAIGLLVSRFTRRKKQASRRLGRGSHFQAVRPKPDDVNVVADPCVKGPPVVGSDRHVFLPMALAFDVGVEVLVDVPDMLDHQAPTVPFPPNPLSTRRFEEVHLVERGDSRPEREAAHPVRGRDGRFTLVVRSATQVEQHRQQDGQPHRDRDHDQAARSASERADADGAHERESRATSSS